MATGSGEMCWWESMEVLGECPQSSGTAPTWSRSCDPPWLGWFGRGGMARSIGILSRTFEST